MKLCVLGNSHLASFKTGWDLIGDRYPHIEATFFGATRGAMRGLRVREGALVPDNDRLREAIVWTSNGLDRITGDYDAYILVGMGFSFPHMANVLRDFRTPDLPRDAEHLISDEALLAAIKGTLDKSGARQLIARVRQISDAPIGYSHDPFHAKASRDNDRYSYMNFDEKVRQILAVYTAMRADLHAVCDVLDQPPETIEDDMFTRAEYWTGAVPLKKGMIGYKRADFAHMNARFGALCLEKLLERPLIKAALG